MKYQITVSEITLPPDPKVPPTCSMIENEVYRQVIEDLDLSKLVLAINATPRGRPAKRKEVTP